VSVASYPNALFTWGADRQNEIDVDWAADANGPAAEILAIENTLGLNPQIEKQPIVGPNPIVYPSVDDRISATLDGTGIPVCSLGNSELMVPNTLNCSAATNYGVWNSYDNVAYDPFGMYNGTVVTIPASGWWRITIGQYWDWWSTGYHRCLWYVGDQWWRHDIWHWDFAGNQVGGWWFTNDDVGQQRYSHTSITWEGVLTQGTIMRVASENGCPHTPHRTWNQEFKAAFVRTVPSGTPAG
jgi:hypothetical protein